MTSSAMLVKRLTAARQCNSVLFCQLYEALTGSRVPGTEVHTHTCACLFVAMVSYLAIASEEKRVGDMYSRQLEIDWLELT